MEEEELVLMLETRERTDDSDSRNLVRQVLGVDDDNAHSTRDLKSLGFYSPTLSVL